MSIFIPPYVDKQLQATQNTRKRNTQRSIPVGNIRPQGESIENVELRQTLLKAVEDANLNLSERMALNQTYFNGEKVIPLFPRGKKEAQITTFHKKNDTRLSDSFTKEVNAVKKPANVSTIRQRFSVSLFGDLETNLNNALAKLKKVLTETT